MVIEKKKTKNLKNISNSSVIDKQVQKKSHKNWDNPYLPNLSYISNLIEHDKEYL